MKGVYNMIIMTIENAGKPFEPLGLVRGSMIQSKHAGKDIMAGLKTFVGGELKAIRRCSRNHVKSPSAAYGGTGNKTGCRRGHRCAVYIELSDAGAAEVTAYGTAVKFK